MSDQKYILFAFSIRSQTFGEVERFHFRSSALDEYHTLSNRHWSKPNAFLQYGVACDGKVISDKRGIPYPLQYERYDGDIKGFAPPLKFKTPEIQT